MQAPDSYADTSQGFGTGASSPRDADGALAVPLGPTADGRPHRRRVGVAAHEALVF
jgi:hypothetical protein